MKKLKMMLALGSVGLLAVGCVSEPLKFPTTAELKTKSYDVLGEGEGQATGLMLFAFIPIGQNERYVKAYDAAVKSKEGDALIDVTVQENWFWAWVLNGYQTHIKGTVIKYKK